MLKMYQVCQHKITGHNLITILSFVYATIMRIIIQIQITFDYKKYEKSFCFLYLTNFTYRQEDKI